MRQCEVVAMVQDRKKRGELALTEAYKTAQRAGVCSGLVKSYTPTREDEPQQATENKPPQATAADLIESILAPLTDAWDTVLTQDVGNTHASASVTVGTLSIPDVPATFLIYLEKQVKDVLTFLEALPTLEPGHRWVADQGGTHRSETVQQVRTRKVPRTLVKYEATKEHPAQTEVYFEDAPVGVWEATQISGALPVDEKRAMVRRATALLEGIRVAREKANAEEIDKRTESEAILRYIFGG